MEQERFTTFEGYAFLSVILLFNVFGGALSRLSKVCANAGWIALILGGCLSFGYFFLYYLLVRRYPGKGLLDIIRELTGTVVSKMLAVLLFCYLLVFCVENLAEATNMLLTNTYAHFRSITVSLAFLAIAGAVNRYPVKGLARISTMCFPLFVFSILFILLMNLEKYDPTYLYPILGHGVRPLVENGIFHVSSFDAFLIGSLFFDSFSSSKSFRRAGLWAGLTANMSFIFSALCYSLYGPYQATQRSQSGLFDLARDIYINRFFQRFESVFIIFASLGKILVLCIGVAAMRKVCNSLFAVDQKHRNKPLPSILLLVLGGGQLLFNWPALWTAFAALTQKTNLFFTVALLALLYVCQWIKKGPWKRRSRAVSMMVVCSLCGLTLSGCAQIGEADEEIFAVVMGYDKSSSETMRITMKIMPEDKKSAGGDTGGPFADMEGSAPHNVFSVDAPCNIPAADLVNTLIPKHLSLLHVKMLVISEELAREDVDMLITSITRYDEIKPTIAVVICDGKAEDFITAKTSELIPFLPLETEMILKRDKDNASYLVRTMEDVYKAYSSTTGDALAMYGGLTMDARAAKEQSDGAAQEETGNNNNNNTLKNPPSLEPQGDPDAYAGGNVPPAFYDDPSVGYMNGYLPGQVPITTAVESQIIGMAVFRDNRMVGTLNSHETAMYMITEGSFTGSVLPVRDPYKPDYYVMYYANTRKNTKIQASFDEDDRAVIDIRAYLQARPVVVHNSDVDYQDPVQREILRMYTTEYLEGQMRALIRKIQSEYDADSLRLGRYVARNFLTTQEWDEYDWRESYKDADIRVSLDLKL